MNRRRFLNGAMAALPLATQAAVAPAASTTRPSQALECLRAAFAADPGYAWTWHCAVACAARDEGLAHDAANRAAARFMQAAFDIDTMPMVGTEEPFFLPEKQRGYAP